MGREGLVCPIFDFSVAEPEKGIPIISKRDEEGPASASREPDQVIVQGEHRKMSDILRH